MGSLRIENCSNYPLNERQSIIDHIRSSLIHFNCSHLAEVKIEELLFIITDGNTVQGGLHGRIAWDWLHIDLLWIEENTRGTGLGVELHQHAEDAAYKKGCIGIHLDTFSFQAPEFYLQLGYEIFGKIDNYPQGFVRYYMNKLL